MGDPDAIPDEDGWGAGGAVWPGDVGTGTAAGTLTSGGVARVRNCELLGGAGKSQGRGTKAAGIILRTRVRDYSACVAERLRSSPGGGAYYTLASVL